MVGRGWQWVVAGVVGCGPQVGTPDQSDSSSSGAVVSESGPPPMGESGVDPDPSTTLTTSTSGDTGTSTGMGDTSSEGETGPIDECGCPPDVPIGLDDMLERGFTPADAMAEFDDAVLELEWVGYPEQPPTLLHVDVAYTGGAIAEGPGGSDGCNFLSFPCHDGVVMEVTLSLSTDDGWLIWTTPAELSGIPGKEGRYIEPRLIAEGDVDASTGSLATQPLLSDDMPVTIETLRYDSVRFELDGELRTGASLVAFVAEDGGFHELAGTPSPYR